MAAAAVQIAHGVFKAELDQFDIGPAIEIGDDIAHQFRQAGERDGADHQSAWARLGGFKRVLHGSL